MRHHEQAILDAGVAWDEGAHPHDPGYQFAGVGIYRCPRHSLGCPQIIDLSLGKHHAFAASFTEISQLCLLLIIEQLFHFKNAGIRVESTKYIA